MHAEVPRRPARANSLPPVWFFPYTALVEGVPLSESPGRKEVAMNIDLSEQDLRLLKMILRKSELTLSFTPDSIRVCP